MTLIEQFPDVSEKVRAKFKIALRKQRDENAFRELPYDHDKSLVKFYDDEFRKWHIKLLFIILSIVAMIYGLVFNAPGLFKWIVD
jgi:hypothetical protein